MSGLTREQRLRRAARYLEKMGSAAPGKGDEHAYSACKVGLGFDLSESEFWPILSAWNNSTASPRNDRALSGKLASVYRRTSKAPGWLVEGAQQRSATDPTPPRRSRDPVYPPQAEVQSFWERATAFADQVPEVSSWLASRGIDYAKLGAHPMAHVRALPRKPTIDLWPAWACFGSRPDGSPRPWHEAGYQCVIPLFDPAGNIRSFKARFTGRGTPPGDGAKSVPARGFDVHRLIMASLPAIMALYHGRWDGHPELRLVEGEPDHLTTIQRIHESDRPGRGVLGIFNGAWSIDLFRRIPPGTVVVYDGHQDAAGGDYLDAMIKLIQTTGLAAVLKAKGVSFRRARRT